MTTELIAERNFRWRSDELTRIESFSDAVFGFAVTLLVVSLQVPRSYHELISAMQNFPAFAVCFAILTQIWHAHYRFFRRYALQTPLAIVLSCVLLFVLLFYAYPLKFLFVEVFDHPPALQVHEARALYVIYGVGYAAISAVLWMPYAHASSHRNLLELNALERLLPRHSLIDYAAQTAIGLIAVLLACVLPERWLSWAGFFYFVLGAYYWIAHSIFGRQLRALRGRLASESATKSRPLPVAAAATSTEGSSGRQPE